MTDKLAAMYPPEVNLIRVVPSLQVPRFANPPSGDRNLGTVREFYGKTIVSEVTVGDGDSIAFIDKAFPHSRFDVMMLISDDHIKSAISDLQIPTRRFLFEVAREFISYVSDPVAIDNYNLDNGYFQMCFNFDRDTSDRENSMFYDKRFHLHLNYWPGSDLHLGESMSWTEIQDVALRRRLLDPIAILAEHIMFEALKGHVAGFDLMVPDLKRDAELGLPAGPKIEFQGWDVLRQPAFLEAVTELHRTAEECYSLLHKCFTGDAPRRMHWERPKLLDRDQIEFNINSISWLSHSTAGQLVMFAGLLRDISANDIQTFRNDEHLRVRQMSLGGLDYAISMFTPKRNMENSRLDMSEQVFLAMQFKLFADIGGAGLPSIDGASIVKLDRSKGAVMSEGEVESRTAFRNEFLEGIWENLSGSFNIRFAQHEGAAMNRNPEEFGASRG